MDNLQVFNLIQRIEAWVDMIVDALTLAVWLDGLRSGFVLGMIVVLVLTHRK